jgi:hypothetical protein
MMPIGEYQNRYSRGSKPHMKNGVFEVLNRRKILLQAAEGS